MKRIIVIGLLWSFFVWGVHSALGSVSAQSADLPTVSSETGEELYLYPDETTSWEPAEWFQDGAVVFTESDWDTIAEYALIDTPSWVFWTDQMTIQGLNNLVFWLVFWLLFWLVVGIGYLTQKGTLFASCENLRT